MCFRDVGEGATLKSVRPPLRLPDAYHSNATHFSPIILANHEKEPTRVRTSSGKENTRTDKVIRELKRQLYKSLGAQDVEMRVSSVDDPATASAQQPSSKDLSDTPSSHQTAKKSLNLKASSTPSTTKPLSATKPSIAHNRERGGDSTPVTQTVRPLPRQSINQNSNNNPSTHSTNGNNGNSTNTANSNAANSSHSNDGDHGNSSTTVNRHNTSSHDNDSSNTAPIINQSVHTTIPSMSPAHGGQPLIVGSTALPSAIIPSYPTVPMVLQGDSTTATTGAVSWIPFVANAAPYNLTPYWTVPSQQTPVIPTMQQQILPTNASPMFPDQNYSSRISNRNNSQSSQSGTSEEKQVTSQQGQGQVKKTSSKSKSQAPAAPQKHSGEKPAKKPVPKSRKINQSE